MPVTAHSTNYPPEKEDVAPCRSLPDEMKRLTVVLARSPAGGPPAFIGVEPSADGQAIDLHVRPAPDGCIEAIVGWRAPAQWLAFGLVGPADLTAGPSRRQAVRIALLASRDGTVTVAAAGEDGQETAWSEPGSQLSGRVLDLCRRALDAPTPACLEPPSAFMTGLWLDRILLLSLRRARSRPLSWAEVVALHPLSEAAHSAHPAALAALASGALGRITWEDLRRRGAQGALAFAPDAAAAAWHDAGSYGRSLLGDLPPPTDLLDDLADLLTPAVHQAIGEVARAWGVRGSGEAAR